MVVRSGLRYVPVLSPAEAALGNEVDQVRSEPLAPDLGADVRDAALDHDVAECLTLHLECEGNRAAEGCVHMQCGHLAVGEYGADGREDDIARHVDKADRSGRLWAGDRCTLVRVDGQKDSSRPIARATRQAGMPARASSC